MRLPGLLAVIGLLLLPSVSAGSESAPEFVSTSAKRDGEGDLLAAWFEHADRGMRVTFKVARLAGGEENVAYFASFRVDGATESAGIGYDANGRLHTDSGANPSGWGRGTLDEAMIVESVRRGSPGYLTLIVPWGTHGLQEGDTVTPVAAYASMCCNPATNEWYAPYDTASAVASSFTVTSSGGLFPILVPRWVIPTIVVVCIAGGMGAGLAIARRTKRAPAAITTSVPVRATRAPPPPPGQRFQRAPPPK